MVILLPGVVYELIMVLVLLIVIVQLVYHLVTIIILKIVMRLVLIVDEAIVQLVGLMLSAVLFLYDIVCCEILLT